MAELVDARDLKSPDSIEFAGIPVATSGGEAMQADGNPSALHNNFTHIYRWDRQGRKGQPCQLTARGKFNSIRLEFADGYTMITSGNSIKRLPA